MSQQAISEAMASFLGAIVLTHSPGFSISTVAQFPILAIPVAVLTSAVLGAGFSYLQRGEQDADAIPLRMLGIAADAFIGGWIAVILPHIPQLAAYGVLHIPMEASAGLAAFLMQIIRKKIGDYFERAFQAALNAWVGFFSRGKSNGEGAP